MSNNKIEKIIQTIERTKGIPTEILIELVMKIRKEYIVEGTCKAYTKSGKKCSKNAKGDSDYCGLHQEDTKRSESGKEREACSAIIKNGTKCTNHVKKGSTFCFRHI